MTRRPGPFVTVLTGPGRGAVAVVRLWGRGALPLADRAFWPNRAGSLSDSPPDRLRVGRVGSGLGDEVVAVVVGDEVEIQCHGGASAVALVVEALRSLGARDRNPRAWAIQETRSTLKAEAMLALRAAPTAKVAEVLLDQADGAFDDEIREILDARPDRAIDRLDRLIERASFGARLVEGWRVVLAGRPNVGKSRLLNALAGFDRSIVDPSPGTTRDVVTWRTAFDGWPVELADTAGLRSTLDPIEAEGVDLARLRQREADLVVVVLDRSQPLDDLDRAVLSVHPVGMVVANKSDLPAAWDEDSTGALAVSAERGDGVEALGRAIAARLVPEVPPSGSGVPIDAGQVRRLALIRDRYATGQVTRGRRSLARWIATTGDSKA